MSYLDDHLESDYEDRMDEQYDPYGYDYSDVLDDFPLASYEEDDSPEEPETDNADEYIGIGTFE